MTDIFKNKFKNKKEEVEYINYVWNERFSMSYDKYLAKKSQYAKESEEIENKLAKCGEWLVDFKNNKIESNDLMNLYAVIMETCAKIMQNLGIRRDEYANISSVIYGYENLMRAKVYDSYIDCGMSSEINEKFLVISEERKLIDKIQSKINEVMQLAENVKARIKSEDQPASN